jgi:hypothetical protein
LLALYERGRLANGSLLIGLVQAAVGSDPAEFASLIPADILARIREMAAAPAEMKWRIATMSSFAGNPSPKQEQASRQQEALDEQMLRDGLNQWRKYFEGSNI